MTRILHRLPVIWLVALIVLPCTAPFSTCDWRDLVSDRSASRSAGPGVVVDHALPHAPVVRVAGARIRPSLHAGRSATAFVVPPFRPDVEWSATRSHRRPVPSTLRLILRI